MRSPPALILQHAARAHRHPADAAAARAQILQHLAGRQLHLLAQPLGDDRDIDEAESSCVFERRPPPSSEVNIPASRQALA